MVYNHFLLTSSSRFHLYIFLQSGNQWCFQSLFLAQPGWKSMSGKVNSLRGDRASGKCSKSLLGAVLGGQSTSASCPNLPQRFHGGQARWDALFWSDPELDFCCLHFDPPLQAFPIVPSLFCNLFWVLCTRYGLFVSIRGELLQ